MFKILTVEEIAEDAFVKAEYVKALETMNTPSDYEERKAAFVKLATARRDASEAETRLLAVTRKQGEPTHEPIADKYLIGVWPNIPLRTF